MKASEDIKAGMAVVMNADGTVKGEAIGLPSMLNSTRVSGQIDDDMLRRLIHGIEHMADGYGGEYGHEDGLHNVEWAMDGDHFLAYQEVRQMFIDAYPDLYPEDEE